MVTVLPDKFQNSAILQFINLFVEKDEESLLYRSKPLDVVGTREKLRILDDVYRGMILPTEYELDFIFEIERDVKVRKRVLELKQRWQKESCDHRLRNAAFDKWLESTTCTRDHEILDLIV